MKVTACCFVRFGSWLRVFWGDAGEGDEFMERNPNRKGSNLYGLSFAGDFVENQFLRRKKNLETCR